MYAASGFITVHDWSYRASQGHTRPGTTYEHAKYLMMTDCALRSRGRTEFISTSDVDELLFSDDATAGSLGRVLTWMHQQHTRSSDVYGFSIKSESATSVYRKPQDQEPGNAAQNLLLNQYDAVEESCKKPYNCGKYHLGRWK